MGIPILSRHLVQARIRIKDISGLPERHPIFTSPRPSMVSPTPQLILHWSFANPIILLTPPSVDLSKEGHHQHEEKKKSEQSSSFILSVEHIRNFQTRK